MISTLAEFARYIVVGAASFAADLMVLVGVRELLLKSCIWGVYVAAVVGFIAGLAVNYILSIKFCFVAAKSGKGRTPRAFILFTVICILGLLWTELGMWLGVGILEQNYILVKIFVSGVVLIWNYTAKKFVVFR